MVGGQVRGETNRSNGKKDRCTIASGQKLECPLVRTVTRDERRVGPEDSSFHSVLPDERRGRRRAGSGAAGHDPVRHRAAQIEDPTFVPVQILDGPVPPWRKCWCSVRRQQGRPATGTLAVFGLVRCTGSRSCAATGSTG